MSLRSYSGIMMEALAFALQDREAMLDCVTDPDDLHRTRHEVSQVRALKETLKENRVDGEVPFSEVELIAEMGDPVWCDNRVGNNGNKVGNFRLRGKPGTIKITRFINNLTDHHRTLVHSVSVIFSLKVTNFIFYSGFLSAERCGPESHFVTNFITIPHPDDSDSITGALWRTLLWAIQDREAMIDGAGTITDRKEAQRELNAIWRLRKRLFKDRQTEMEAFFEEADTISISKLMQRRQ